MIKIRMIKNTTGSKIVNDYESKYGTIKNLKKLISQDEENVKLFFDLEEWKHYLLYPNEKVTDGKTIYRDHSSISMLEIELMNFIKYEHPKSIRELAKMIQKDITTVQKKIKNLEEEGFVELKEGSKNSKIPVLTYDSIEIAV